MKQRYIDIRFNAATLNLINTVEGICDEYAAAGFVLTVRQLYYQLVSRAVVENTERSYDQRQACARIGAARSDPRLRAMRAEHARARG